MAENAITDAETTVDQGLAAVGKELENAIAANPVNTAAVMALDSLRTRYVFDRMQLTRAEIIVIDDSPAMMQAVQAMTSARQNLDTIQQQCTATTDWINSAATKLDGLMDAVNKLKAALS